MGSTSVRTRPTKKTTVSPLLSIENGEKFSYVIPNGNVESNCSDEIGMKVSDEQSFLQPNLKQNCGIYMLSQSEDESCDSEGKKHSLTDEQRKKIERNRREAMTKIEKKEERRRNQEAN